tara:strand:- start:317 stop:607 length:291 start_codon:yes stop_codon:yes gene_type:complete
MSEANRQFKFPESVTRRERLTFSKHAGITIQGLGHLMTDDPLSITVEAEAALILIAAQRVDPSITFEQVMDNDGWELDATEVVEPDPLPPPPAKLS